MRLRMARFNGTSRKPKSGLHQAQTSLKKPKLACLTNLCCCSVLWKCILLRHGLLGVSLFPPFSSSSVELLSVSDTKEVLEYEDLARFRRSSSLSSSSESEDENRRRSSVGGSEISEMVSRWADVPRGSSGRSDSAREDWEVASSPSENNLFEESQK